MEKIKHSFFQSVNNALAVIEMNDFGDQQVDFEDAADSIQVYFTL